VAKQHQAPFLNNSGERWVLSYSPHFMTGHTLIPACTSMYKVQTVQSKA